MRRNNNFECIQIANWDLGHADFKHETFSRSFLSPNNIQHTFIWRCVGVELNLFYMHTQTKQHVSLKCALYISLLRNEREKSSKESSKQHDDSSSTSSSTQQWKKAVRLKWVNFSETHICVFSVERERGDGERRGQKGENSFRLQSSARQHLRWNMKGEQCEQQERRRKEKRSKKLDEKNGAKRERCDVSEHNYSAHISYTTFCWSKKFSKRRKFLRPDISNNAKVWKICLCNNPLRSLCCCSLFLFKIHIYKALACSSFPGMEDMMILSSLLAKCTKKIKESK